MRSPLETRVRDENGAVLTDLADSSPTVTHRREGLNEIVTVECALKDQAGRASGLRVKTTLQYRWGYVKIRKELLATGGVRVREICPLATVLAPSLSDYGYREGITEEEKAPPFSFGSNRWGKLRFDHPLDAALRTRYVPRSMIFADPGVEGLEWFVGSDLSQWELQLGGRRGGGQCLLERNQDPPGLAFSVSPLWSADAAALPSACVFDFYVAFPILDGHAHPPWLHTSFNRNRGDWVSTEEIRRWAEKGIQTVHCHNDGDCYNDGLFWRDGSYPPYPDMDRYDKVLTDCRRAGIRTATYFSNKELHPSTREFQKEGEQWGRKDRKGGLQHNFSSPNHEFGVQMCLHSGWLDFLKFSIDRVLKNHPLDGVYYDWNVALFCSNPLHEGNRDRAAGPRPLGHGRTSGPDGVDPPARGPERTGHRPQHHDADVRHREFRRLRRGNRVGLPEMDRAGTGPARPAAGMVAGRRGSAGRHQLRRPRRQCPAPAPSALSPSRRCWAAWPLGRPARRPSPCFPC